MSTVTAAPISYAVYSTMSFYARHRRGGELPGAWYVRAFATLGHAAPAVRQTLFRMERGGELLSRRAGRAKYYRLTPWAQAEADAGLAKILEPRQLAWDGRWTLLHARFDGGEREHRERLYEVLRAEGFATLGAGGFIHPRDRGARMVEIARSEGVGSRLVVIRGPLQATRSTREFVADHWDIDALGHDYREFSDRFGLLRSQRRWSDQEAFALRFAVVFAYLEVAWRDPELPSDLLPYPWPGYSARSLARSLYRRLLPGARRFADSVRSRESSVSRGAS